MLASLYEVIKVLNPISKDASDRPEKNVERAIAA